jgi:hypothetical protein
MAKTPRPTRTPDVPISVEALASAVRAACEAEFDRRMHDQFARLRRGGTASPDGRALTWAEAERAAIFARAVGRPGAATRQRNEDTAREVYSRLREAVACVRKYVETVDRVGAPSGGRARQGNAGIVGVKLDAIVDVLDGLTPPILDVADLFPTARDFFSTGPPALLDFCGRAGCFPLATPDAEEPTRIRAVVSLLLDFRTLAGDLGQSVAAAIRA